MPVSMATDPSERRELLAALAKLGAASMPERAHWLVMRHDGATATAGGSDRHAFFANTAAGRAVALRCALCERRSDDVACARMYVFNIGTACAPWFAACDECCGPGCADAVTDATHQKCVRSP